MATLTANTQLTLLELAKSEHNGQMLATAEILTRVNDILLDAPWVPANDRFSHVTTQRYSLPTGQWRKFNAGVGHHVTQRKQITDTIGMLEDYGLHDKALVDNAANPAQWRNDENAGVLEGMSQTFATTIIYGNQSTDPEQFTGLAPRLGTLNTTNVLGAGGTGSDVSSIYVVQWGVDKVHLVYPRGSMLGLSHRDLGEDTIKDADLNEFQAYRDHFQLHVGLVVRNPRCIGRVANMETTGSSNIFDEDLLIKILNRMPMKGRGAVLYANPTVMSQIDIAAKDKGNVWHTITDPFGNEVLSFRGIPIRMVEAITDTETAIT